MNKSNIKSNTKKQKSPQKQKDTRSPTKAVKIVTKKNNLNYIRNWKNEYQELPRRQQNKKLPITKNTQDNKNDYKYREQFGQLQKRSSLAEIANFILGLINKSEEKELSNTDKFMLAGYIDVYIKEKYMNGEYKDNSPPTIQKLKAEWNRLLSSWELYKIKLTRCQIGQDGGQKQQQITNGFQILQKQFIKISNKKQRLQPLRKLMKKFYDQLIR